MFDRERLIARFTKVGLLNKPRSTEQPNCLDFLSQGLIDLVINIRDSQADDGSKTDGYMIRCLHP